MNANRVSGPGSPDSNKPIDQKAQREETQRIEKVREVDPDEQARQQRFKQIMQTEPDEPEEKPVTSPSPFESSFHLSKGLDSSDLSVQSLPSPAYSPPPNLSSGQMISGEDFPQADSGEDLPQSDQFWTRLDISDQPIEKPQIDKESGSGKTTSTSQTKAGKKTSGEDQKTSPQIEPSPFGLPGKPSAKKESVLLKKGSHNDESKTPSGRYWTPEEAPSPSIQPGSGSTKQTSKTKNILSSKERQARASSTSKEMFEPPLKGFTPTLDPSDEERVRIHTEKLEAEKKERKLGKSVDIVPPSLPELPQTVQPVAIAATNAASPYLRPEALPIFFQMVGSMLIMSAPPGISRTEITLNNPAFTNSKFFGSTIEIIKYSTAPDSFNIRLTGTNEAVAAFNQNIPSLVAAFQVGHFNFRVGRIDAEYTVERPVLRRKSSKDDGGSGDKQEEPNK